MNTNPKLKKLKQKKDQIEARIKNMEAKEKSKSKKLDTRRKILIGAFYMEQMEKNEDAKKKIIARLDGFLTRPLDRQLFGLPETRKVEKPVHDKKTDVTPKTPEKRKMA